MQQVHYLMKGLDATVSNITIYSNPTKNNVFVDIRMIQEETILEVYTMLGNLVQKQSLLPSTISNVFDMSDMAQGVCLFAITGKDGEMIMTHKVVKQ